MMTRNALSMGLYALLCCLSILTWPMFRTLPHERVIYRQEVLQHAAAARAALERLPSGVLVVGYLGDSPLVSPEGQDAGPRAWLRHAAAQAGGAPRLLVTGPDPEWVLGDFCSPAALRAALLHDRSLQLVGPYGQDLVLLRRLP